MLRCDSSDSATYLELQLEDLEADPELERRLRLRLNLPSETELVHYPPQASQGEEEQEEQTTPLDLSQMLPVGAIIEVINEEAVGDDFPDLMDDNFLIDSGSVSYILLTCGKYQVLSQIPTSLQSVSQSLQ